MRKKRLFKLVLFFTAIVFTVSFAYAAASETAKEDRTKLKDDLYGQVEIFADAVSIVRTDYADDVDSKKLIYGALKGMLSSLDDFSAFLEPDEYKEMQLETKGEFGGIGIEISNRDGIITIITPIAATPAEAAGIKPGDKIVKIDDKITKNMSLNEAVKMMRGDPGTQVKLTIWREKEEKVLDIPIKRAVIKIKSVKKAEFLDGKIGYIKLVEFQENTPRDMDEALKKLKDEGMDALILDLRNNPGGLLDTSVDVSERFLPEGKTIVSLKSRTPEQNAVFKSSGRFFKNNYPLVVLVNEGSASASEIVAGAVQDNKRGIIVGAKTFGKASVQTVIPLRDGSALRLTSASYFTPSGRMIRNQGIIPDVAVELENGSSKKKEKIEDVFEKVDKAASSAKSTVERDNQLEAALNVVRAIRVYKSVGN